MSFRNISDCLESCSNESRLLLLLLLLLLTMTIIVIIIIIIRIIIYFTAIIIATTTIFLTNFLLLFLLLIFYNNNYNKGYSESVITSLNNIKPFFRNVFVIKPSALIKITILMKKAIDIAMNNLTGCLYYY